MPLRCTLIVLLCMLLLFPLSYGHQNSKSSWPQTVRNQLDQRYSVVSSIDKLTESGQITQVSVREHAAGATSSISTSSSQRRRHLLALYPSPSDATHTIPFTFVNISKASPSYASTGRATVPIKLLNLRSPGFVLRLVSNGTLFPQTPATVVLAESAVITNTMPQAPGQVHLAQHADGHSIVVQWVSGSDSPQQLHYSRTKWRLQHSSSDASSPSSPSRQPDSSDFVHSVASSSVTYTAGMMCGEPASSFGFLEPGFLHSAVIPGRDVGHNRQLYYRVGSTAVGWSRLHTFTSAPSAADVAAGRSSFTFLVFNDVGQENAVLFDNVCPPYCPAGWAFEAYTANSTKLLRHLQAEPEARLGLLVGDLAYANGYLVDWDYFGFQFEPAFSKWPLMVAAGNHEAPATGSANVRGNTDASGGECGVPYTYRFYTPAWEALASPTTLPQPSIKVSSEASTRQPSGLNAATATTTASAKLQPPNNRPHRGAAPQGLARPPPSGQAVSQHLAATKPVGVPPAPRGRSRQGLSTGRSFYSFEMGGVHFLMLDTESPSEPGSSQGMFVASDLAKVDRHRTPWLVVGLHRQMVGPTTDPVNLENLARLQGDLEDIFLQYKVDLVLQGHDHAYARTCPFAKGKCTANTKSSGPQPTQPTSTSTSSSSSVRRGSGSEHVVEVVHNPRAPIYILAGHAGAGFTHSFPSPLPEWVVFGAENQNGYLRVTVSANALRVVSVSTDDGQVMDGVEVVRDQPPS